MRRDFPFNSNANASLKFLIMVSPQKRKFNPYRNQIYIANLRTFSNQRSVSALKLSFLKSSLPFVSLFMCIKHLFILRILFQSNLIRRSVTHSASINTRWALEDSSHSESIFCIARCSHQWIRGLVFRKWFEQFVWTYWCYGEF